MYSLTFDFNRELDEKANHVISYGAEANYNDVNSIIVLENRKTGIRSEGRDLTRYPSAGSQWQSLGTYLNYRWANTAKTIFVNAGARYSDITAKAKYARSDVEFINWPESYFEGIENKNADLSWAAGITWNSKDKWQVRTNISKAFRSPNIDDLFKNRVKNNKAVLPNENLKPEISRNVELTIAKTLGALSTANKIGFKLSGTGFYTLLDDAIVRRDNGFTIEGVGGLEIFDVQQNINAVSARVYGLSGNAEFSFGENLKLSSGLNFTKGETDFTIEEDGLILLDTITPLDHIPPIYLSLIHISEPTRPY